MPERVEAARRAVLVDRRDRGEHSSHPPYERLKFRPFVRSMLAAIDEPPKPFESGDA
jgi:hypothetical protein